MNNILAKIKALPFFDKILHIAGGLIAVGFVALLFVVEQTIVPGMLNNLVENVLFNSVVAVAAAKEAQDYIDHKNGLPHTADPLDFFATVAGGVVGIVLLKVLIGL